MNVNDTHGIDVTPLHPAHHYTRPDISLGLPGLQALNMWADLAAAIECKLLLRQDPIDWQGKTKQGPEHETTRVQIYKVARNLLMAHLSSYVFVPGIYGRMMRIFRIDHSGIIASEAFDYVDQPGLVMKFLWHLVHPHHFEKRPPQPFAVVGADPTMYWPSEAEFDPYYNRLVAFCLRSGIQVKEKEELQTTSRLIDVCIDESGGVSSSSK